MQTENNYWRRNRGETGKGEGKSDGCKSMPVFRKMWPMRSRASSIGANKMLDEEERHTKQQDRIKKIKGKKSNTERNTEKETLVCKVVSFSIIQRRKTGKK